MLLSFDVKLTIVKLLREIFKVHPIKNDPTHSSLQPQLTFVLSFCLLGWVSSDLVPIPMLLFPFHSMPWV